MLLSYPNAGIASVVWGGSTGGLSLIVVGGLSLTGVGGLSFIVVVTICASGLVWGRASLNKLAARARRARANAGLYIHTPSMLTCQSSGWLLIDDELDVAVLVSLFKNLLTPAPSGRSKFLLTSLEASATSCARCLYSLSISSYVV
jgi:hypothetical protein